MTDLDFYYYLQDCAVDVTDYTLPEMTCMFVKDYRLGDVVYTVTGVDGKPETIDITKRFV